MPPPRNTPNDDFPPELLALGKFEALGKLGEGGMGAVYKARHRFLDRVVAIKVMSGKALGNDDARHRFLGEMRAGGHLSHPNIAQTIDAAISGDFLYLVMEFLEGATLDKVVAGEGPLPVALACRCAVQAAEGLRHAHLKGLVHRDVKPANLLLTRDRTVKLLDLGLARLPPDEGVARRTQLQTFMGTADFIPPEQALNARDADARSDIYSLGCTLYFLLSGRPPFRKANAYEVATAHLTEPPSPLPNVPAELWAVVARMMAKDRDDRHQTAQAVIDALMPFTARQQQAAPAEPPRKRSHWPAYAGVAAAGLAFAALLVWVTRPKKPDEPAPHPPQVAVTPPPEAPKPKPPELLHMPMVEPPPPVVVTKPPPKPAEPSRKPTSMPGLAVGRLRYHDEFAGGRLPWPVGKSKDVEHGFKDGTYFIHRHVSGGWGWYNGKVARAENFAVELVGRVAGRPGDAWGLSLVRDDTPKGSDKKRSFGPQVLVYHEGTCTIAPSIFATDKEIPRAGPRRDKTTQPAQAGDAWNTLLVVVRGRQVQVFLNGIEGLRNVTLKEALNPNQYSLIASGRNAEARAEFKRFTMWELPAEADK